MTDDFNWDIDFSVIDSHESNVLEKDEQEYQFDENVLEIEKNEEKKQELINDAEKKFLAVQKNLEVRQRQNEDRNLTEQQLNAIDMYMQGVNKTQIAKAIGVTRQTVIKWFKKDEFKAELQEREEEVNYTVYHELFNYVPKSVKIIKGIIENDEIPARERLKGIQMLWDATGFSKHDDSANKSNTTVININPEYFPQKTINNNSFVEHERVIEEDFVDTIEVKFKEIDENNQDEDET